MNWEMKDTIILVGILVAICFAVGGIKFDRDSKKSVAAQVVEKKENLFEVVEDYDQHHSYQVLRYKPTRSLWVKGLGRAGDGPSVFVKISDGEVEVK